MIEGFKNDKIKLVWVTPEIETMIMRIARVSSDDPKSDNVKLLTYLINPIMFFNIFFLFFFHLLPWPLSSALGDHDIPLLQCK